MAYTGMKRFVHLGLNRRGLLPLVLNPTIEGYLNKVAGDWFRYGERNYVVFTDADLAEFAQGITRLPGMANFWVFASEISPGTFNGMMPPEFWAWLNKPRSPY